MADLSNLVRPVAIDCFAGAGGLSLGLIRSGLNVRAAFDSDADAVETYRHNISNHIHPLNAVGLSGATLLAIASLEKGTCSLVAGGPPCQGFSVQRRGAAEDLRNDMVFEFLRIVLEIQPTMFLMENV